MKNSGSTTSSSAPRGVEAPGDPGRRRALCLALALALAWAPWALAASPAPKSDSPAAEASKAVEESTAALQRQVSTLAEDVVALLGEEDLGPQDIRAIVEVLSLQRAVEVYANLVASHSRNPQQEIVVQSLPMVEEHWRRVEQAMAEAPHLEKRMASKLPSAAHPVSIRSTLEELRASLGLSREPVVSQQEVSDTRGDLAYLGPEPTDDEMQAVVFNLQRLRSAAETMGQGKCYREFWTRNCADALEYHALPHQKRSFVKLLVTTRDLMRKYCASPRLAPLRREYEGLIRHLAVRPIVYDYGARTTPFVERPDLLELRCPEAG